MDNDTIHLYLEVKELITARGAIIIYTAPYSLYLGPIEFMFNNNFESGECRDIHMMAIESSVSRTSAKLLSPQPSVKLQ